MAARAAAAAELLEELDEPVEPLPPPLRLELFAVEPLLLPDDP
jgi:hypothetical protein